jgi:lipocalin-like protein
VTSKMLATLAVLALSTATASSYGAPDAAALIGSWKLLSYEDRDANGASVYPYGKAPAGLLVYDATGHMAIQIMTTPPPDVASDDWNLFTVKEKIALYDAYIAYFGRYEVDSARKIVIHLPEADLSRLYIGRREERHYELAGDRFVLTATWTQSGKTWSGTRVFERLR